MARVSGSLIESNVPWPGSLCEVHRAVEQVDLGLDDVHAHPPAGNLRDLFGRTQARRPDHLVDLVRRHFLGVDFAEQALFQAFPQDPLGVQSRAVVANLDHHVVAAVECVEGDRSLARFSGRLADVGQFDAVIGGIADHVDQRIAQLVDHPLVELGLLAVDYQADLLPVAPRDVADHPLETREERADGHHPRIHDRLLDGIADAVELVNGLEEIVDRVGDPFQSLHFREDAFQFVVEPPGLTSHGLQFRRGDRRSRSPLLLVAQSPQAGQEPRNRLHPSLGRRRVFKLVAELRKTGLADHQLSGKVHQLIKLLDIDPQGLGQALRSVGGDGLGLVRLAVGVIGSHPIGRRPCGRRGGWSGGLVSCRPRHRTGHRCVGGGSQRDGRASCVPGLSPKSVSTVNSSTPAIFRCSRTMSHRLVRHEAEGNAFQDIELVELLLWRVEVTYLAQIGELVVDQLTLESRHRQSRLESHLADQAGRPTGAVASTQRRSWPVIPAARCAWRRSGVMVSSSGGLAGAIDFGRFDVSRPHLIYDGIPAACAASNSARHLAEPVRARASLFQVVEILPQLIGST